MSSDNRRNEIIDKARPVFARFGLKKATMSNIAKELDLQKGALYYYFRSKEELFAAVIEDESIKLQHRISTAVKKQTKPYRKVLAFFKARLKYLNDCSEYFTTLKREFYEGMIVADKTISKYFEWEKDLLCNIINEGIADKSFQIKSTHVKSLTSALIIGLKGMENQWALNADMAVIGKDVEEFLRIIFIGIYKNA